MVLSFRDPLPAIVAFAGQHARIRALLLNGSRARPGATLDVFSDTDVAFVLDDVEVFKSDPDWHLMFGEPLVDFTNDRQFEGHQVHNRLVLYRDRVKVDFLCWPTEVLTSLKARKPLPAVLDQGYEILLDKGGLCDGLGPATGAAFVVARPSKAEFVSLVNEFWWETTYVAKNLSRGDLLFAKYNLDVVMKLQLLLRMLEWSVSMRLDWAFQAGLFGRGLKQFLDGTTLKELEESFAGGEGAEQWASLWRTCGLFRRAAQSVAEGLGYRYPAELDRDVTAYLESVEQLGR